MSLGVVQRQCLLAGLSLILTSVSFPALGETRLALVISNASYPAEIGKLENSHKNGTVTAAALEAVGFVARRLIEGAFERSEAEEPRPEDRLHSGRDKRSRASASGGLQRPKQRAHAV